MTKEYDDDEPEMLLMENSAPPLPQWRWRRQTLVMSFGLVVTAFLLTAAWIHRSTMINVGSVVEEVKMRTVSPSEYITLSYHSTTKDTPANKTRASQDWPNFWVQPQWINFSHCSVVRCLDWNALWIVPLAFIAPPLLVGVCFMSLLICCKSECPHQNLVLFLCLSLALPIVGFSIVYWEWAISIIWMILILPISTTWWFLLVLKTIVCWIFFALTFLFKLIFDFTFPAAKHQRTHTSELPVWVYVPLAAVVVIAGIAVPVMTGGNLELKFEIFAGSADVASDLLWCLSGKFWGDRLMISACVVTAAGSVVASTWLFGGRIFGKLLPFLICMPWRRLKQHGMHQACDVVGASPEKAIINFLACVALVLAGALAPVVAMLYCVVLFLLGCLLQGMKLTFVVWLKNKFTHWCFPFEEESNDTSGYAEVKRPQEAKDKTDGQIGQEATTAVDADGEEAIVIDAAAFHIGNITEVVFETLPSITLNVINMRLLARDEITSVQWTSVLSLCVSVYMIFRQSYKYFFYFAIEKISLNNLPIPGMENTNQSRALAAASGASAVASATTAMAKAAVQ